MFGYLVLLLTFVLMFGVSFYFALREWLRPEDDAPIPVDVEYVRMENYFGASFRAKMQVWLETAKPIQSDEPLEPPVESVLEKPNGERILMLSGGQFGGDSARDELLFCDGDLDIADRSVFLRELYSRGNVDAGVGVKLQAVAAEGDVSLGPHNDVARWVDAAGKIWLRRGTIVHARVSSQDTIQLDTGVGAQSLYAPLIFTAGFELVPDYAAPGDGDKDKAKPVAEWQDELSSAEVPSSVARLASDTLLVRGDLQLKPASRIESNLIVHGTLRSGSDCAFFGDVKAGSVELGSRNTVSRNLVSGSYLNVGASCRVAKSIVAETDIRLATGTRVGQPGKLAVVTAGREIVVEQDVAVWGKLSAGKLVNTI
jgi:hypothetical protein